MSNACKLNTDAAVKCKNKQLIKIYVKIRLYNSKES